MYKIFILTELKELTNVKKQLDESKKKVDGLNKQLDEQKQLVQQLHKQVEVRRTSFGKPMVCTILVFKKL